MRIGIIAMGLETNRDFRFAGVARYAFSVLDEIARGTGSEHEYIFFLLPDFEVPEHWKSARNVKIRRTWKRFNRWTLLVSGIVASVNLLDFLFSTANSLPLWSKVPCGVFIHDLFPLDHPEWFPENTASVNGKTIPRAISQSAIVFANSEDTKNSIVRHFGTSREKIVVTPLAAGNPIQRIPPSEVDWNALSELGIRGRRFVLTLSTIEPRKNLGRVFEAFAEIRKRPELEEVELVVAGSKGWKYEAALAKIEELGLADRVRLLGYIPDAALPNLFSACEIYLCASISEGFGMPLVEAMSAGCPVLSSNGGALPEVGGSAIRYFEPESVISIASALSGALRFPESGPMWGERSLKKSSEFSWKMTVQLTLESICRLTRESPQSASELPSPSNSAPAKPTKVAR